MPWTYCLQILQGHLSNVRHLICVFNISSDLASFISSGTKLQIIGPILLMDSRPKCVMCDVFNTYLHSNQSGEYYGNPIIVQPSVHPSFFLSVLQLQFSSETAQRIFLKVYMNVPQGKKFSREEIFANFANFGRIREN